MDSMEAARIMMGGGSSVLGSKTITQNGTYNARDDSFDGYSSVVVDVPSGICEEISRMNVCGGGTLIGDYYFQVKYGRLAESGKFSSWTVGTASDADPILYEYEVAKPLDVFTCIYDGDNNMMEAYKHNLGQGAYMTEYYARRLCSRIDGNYYVYADKENITLGVGQTNYNVSVNNTNFSLSITLNEYLQESKYNYDGSISSRNVSTNTRYLYAYIPEGSYGGSNRVYTPLSQNDFDDFVQDMVQLAYDTRNPH